MRFRSRSAVMGKIEWEGGFPGFMEYGIRADDMPEGDEELENAWRDFDLAWDALEVAWRRVEALLPDAYEGEDE